MRNQTTRLPLTTEELTQLKADDFLRLKLTDDEKSRLREINEARGRERAERVKRHRAEQAPLLAELQAFGLDIQAVSDLINTSVKYDQAIPILLKHLLLPYSDVTRETIARSMAVPESKEAWPILIAEYRKTPTGIGENGFKLGAKDGLACALSATATDATMEELIDLAKDRTHGESRVLLLSALRKSKNPLAKEALADLESDPDLTKEIASWRKR